MLKREDRELFQQAMDYGLSYMDTIDQRSVFPEKGAVKDLQFFNEPLSAEGTTGPELLAMLNRYGAPATVAQTGGRYFGFVNGGALVESLAAGWLASVWDQNAALYLMSPVAVHLETVCQQWLVDLFNLPDECVMGLVGGSSTATLCGLAAARTTLLKKQGWDVNEQGLQGAPSIRIILGEQAHSSVLKGLAILGFGRAQLELVPADSEGRMMIDKLPSLDETCLVICQAGNVNSGAFDPIGQIADLTSQADGWLHVDGAFGLWCACSQSRRYLTRGIEKADSWSVDGHKTLNTPYDCGIILCRHQSALAAAMQAAGSYLHYSDHYEPMAHVVEMSRRARGIELWAALKMLGRKGVEQLIDRLHYHAFIFAGELEAHGFQILNEVVFNQVLVACSSPEETELTLQNIQAAGTCWCGGTKINGKAAIRISVCSAATDENDIKHSVDSFAAARQAAKKKLSEKGSG